MNDREKVLGAIAANKRGDNVYSVKDQFLLDVVDDDGQRVMAVFEELVREGRARERSLGGYTIELF